METDPTDKVQQSINAIGADQGLDALAVRDIIDLVSEKLHAMMFQTEDAYGVELYPEGLHHLLLTS